MPLETGTYLPDLNASNPTHADSLNQGDAHIRLIKSALKNTFPNWTSAALTSTQAQLDAAATFVSGVIKCAVDGTITAPAFTFTSELGLGFYRKAANTLAITIAGVDVWKISGGGVDIITAGALKAGGTAIFPLQSANIGALQVLTAAIAANAVTYAKLQNAVGANVLLGAPTAAGPFQEITLGSGLGISGGVLSNTAVEYLPIPQVTNLAIDNDGTNPNTRINVSADACVLVDGSGNTQRYFGVSVQLDFATTGANGCDVGTRAATKGYYIYLIGNGTTVAALASLDTNGSPTFPSGYTAAKRIGWYKTDGSSNLLRIRTRNDMAVYTASLPSVASGANAGVTGALTAIVSPNATRAIFKITCNTGAVSVGASASMILASLAAGVGSLDMLMDTSLQFYYSSTAANDASIRGFVFPQ